MAEILDTEFENGNGYVNYPFSKNASLVDTDGNELPVGCIVDAVLYPKTGHYRLSDIYKSDDGVSTIVKIATDTSEYATGVLSRESKYVDFYDADGFHRGTVQVGDSMYSCIDDPTPHTFVNARFCSSCQFELGSSSVDSLYVGGNKLFGDVTLIHGGGRVAIRPVTSSNDDGSYNLRFDVVPVSSITDLKNTGIRTIYVLRQPTSMFNVLDRDGSPYLYLVKSGTASKISRDYICSYKNDKKTGGSYKEVSYSDDCGSGSKSSSGATGSCFPTRANLESMAKTYDRETREMVDTSAGISFGYSYGYVRLPAVNGFTAPSSMCTMFIEGEIFVTMQAYNYGVLATFRVYNTEAAEALFGTYEYASVFSITLKHTAYKQFFEYVRAKRRGGLGFVDHESLVDLCDRNGWSAKPSEIGYPDDVDPFQFTYDLKKEISDNGLSSYTSLYINRARDFFEHYDCVNWEVSSADNLGDEVRWLVGWGQGSRIFAGGNSYVSVSGSDGVSANVPAWIVARYVWWKKYSKNGTQMRHFIVPKERGITIYTGSYYADQSHTAKEMSPASWSCDTPLLVWTGNFRDTSGFECMSTKWMDGTVLANMRQCLHNTYPEGYDPTFGDSTFKYSESDMSSTISISGFNVGDLADQAMRFDNRVTSETLLAMPEDAPVFTEESDDGLKTTCSAWPGPFEFEYDKVYIPGVGFDDGDSTESIRAPIAFKFEIDKASSNSFNIDVTDLTAVGMVYKNPIHVGLVEGSSAPNTLNISNPTDANEVSDAMTNLTKQKTTGNGIEISIPGIGD